MGKILEKIIACRLTFMVGCYELISGAQSEGKANLATTNAILSFVHDIHTAWNHDKVTSAFTFDIKGYFDFVNHDRLLVEMQKHQIPLEYLKWTSSFLLERKATICVDGARDEMTKVENRIPQGSPISSILASFYLAGLLDLFEKNPNSHIQDPLLPDDPTITTLFMYVDNEKLTVSSKSLETNVKILSLAYCRVNQWLQKAGLTLDKDKRELIHYTQRCLDGSPAICLPKEDGSISIIPVTLRDLDAYYDAHGNARIHQISAPLSQQIISSFFLSYSI